MGMMSGARLDDVKVGSTPMTSPQAHFRWEKF